MDYAEHAHPHQENTPLYLETDDHVYAYDDSQDPGEHESSTPSNQIQTRRLLHVALAVTLFSCSLPIHSLVISQLTYAVFAEQETGNRTINTRSDPCVNSTSTNMSETALIHKIQDMTSDKILFLELTSNGLSVVTNLVFGVISSKISRRTLLFIPAFGYFLRSFVVTIVCGCNLGIDWLFLAYTLDGLLGSQTGVYLGTFLYTTDITSRDSKRTLGVAIVETTKGFIGSVMNIVAGNLLQDTDFFITSLVVTIIMFLAMVVILFLPDQRPHRSHRSSVTFTERLISPFTSGSPTTKQMVLFGYAAWFIYILEAVGVMRFRDLFLMNLPFCFSAIEIGWLEFTQSTIAQLFALTSVATLSSKLPGVALAIIGNCSTTIQYLFYGLARSTTEIFITPVFAIGESITSTILRGEMSRLFGPDQQGPLLAFLGVLESLAFTLASPIFLPIYKDTQDYPAGPGSAFLFATLFLASLLGVLAMYQLRWMRHQKELHYAEIVIQEKDEHD